MKSPYYVLNNNIFWILVLIYGLLLLIASFFVPNEVPDEDIIVIPIPEIVQKTEIIIPVKITAYNSLESQTDSTPFITATNNYVRPGIAAVSRDLLNTIVPYGTVLSVRIDHENEHNKTYCRGYAINDLVIDDTMHPRKQNQIDIWFESYEEAVLWGSCLGRARLILD